MSGADDLKSLSKNDLIREIRRLRTLLDEQMSAAPGVGPRVDVVGIVGSRDGQPAVHMRSGEAAWQMTVAQAREHAADTFAAAIEAERDAATVAFLSNTGMGEQEVGGFLALLRDHRIAWAADNAVIANDPRQED